MESLPLTIRKAEMKDAPQVAEFNRLMARETEALSLDPDIVLAGVKSLLKDQHKGFYLLACTCGEPQPRIVGQLMVTFEWSDWRNKHFWWVQSVYIPPEARAHKVFSRLFRHLEEMARYHRDVAGLRLYVAKHNDSAKSVYEALGMNPTGYDMYELAFETL